MKIHLMPRPLFAAAALAVLLPAAPIALHAQQPTPTPGSSDSDVFDIIKKGADKLQKQAKETKELGPKVKLLEERQNDLHKKMTELEQKLGKQEEIIEHLHKEIEKLEANKPVALIPPVPPAPAASPAGIDPLRPAPPLPVTEPPVKPTPEPSPTAS